MARPRSVWDLPPDTPPRPPLRDETVRRLFFGGWAIVAVVMVVVLVLTAGAHAPFGTTDTANYVGSKVPTGTNFTFLFSETIALYTVTSGTGAGNATIVVTVWGNWTATAPTFPALSINGVSPACPAPWGCFGEPGTGSGTLGHNVTLHPNARVGGLPGGFTVALEFWSTGQDTVRAASPIYATASSGDV